MVDLECDFHNPVINRFSGIMCSCGEELEERELEERERTRELLKHERVCVCEREIER